LQSPLRPIGRERKKQKSSPHSGMQQALKISFWCSKKSNPIQQKLFRNFYLIFLIFCTVRVVRGLNTIFI